ncbi:hypothetical protein H9L39_16607 [Fusarium oxysporum f. sp. albedinis]|nr:hypothetical protein H9L39_16607 [Fusarium oxysporum f. sp. albedinis]
MKEDNETNCLHAAISGSSKFIREIISLMETYRPESQPKKHPFEARESNAGNTPLHLAIKNVTTAHLQGLWKYLHPETLKFLGGPDNAKADQWASENDDGRALTSDDEYSDSDLESDEGFSDSDLEGIPENFRNFVILDPLASFISYHCIKNMDRNIAISCLYSTGKAIKTTGYGQRTKATMSSNRKGREDMTSIFNWLHKGGVRKILKVTVIDDELPAHKDAAIVECLRRFGVEIWDWKKVDLCSEVIAASTSLVREICLYSSGNQAVLKGWSAAGGFADRAKFPELLDVIVFLREGQEDKRTLREYGSCLKNELEQPVPESGKPALQVKPIIDEASRSWSYSSQIRAKDNPGENDNPRIAQMKKLTEFLRSIENKGQEPTRPVKIAIVDDGLDSSIIDLNHARIMTGNSFWPSSPESANAYFVPSGNHGTQIASLICQLCPRTELYIARLEEQYTQSGHRVINAASAALAVEWATHCGVDIICMSWTIERPGKEMPTDLKDAVKKAKKEGIVMFCAASDQGGSSSLQCYPGAFEKTCIRIGSCSSSDVASAWVHHDLVDFLLPGENILVTNGDGTAQEQQGSSFATAIASGLGGLLIYLGLVLGKSHGSFKLDWNYEHMMRTLFNGSIPIPGVEGQKLVKPESRILDEYTTKLESLLGTKDQRQRCPWTGRFVLHSRWKRSER